jgi:hypothetical protein
MVSLMPAPRAKHVDKKALEGLDRETAREEIRKITARPGDAVYLKLGHFFIALSQGNRKWVVFAISMIITFGGIYLSRTYLKVGDVSAGKAILYPDHSYNIASDLVNKKFIGSSQLVVVAEGKNKGAMKALESLELLEDLKTHALQEIPSAGGATSVTDMVKAIYRMFHEGYPMWSMLPEEPSHVGQMLFSLEAGSKGGEMDRYISPDYKNATVTIYFREYNNEVITNAIATLKRYIKEHPLEQMKFRLAGGILGILAAVNEEVEWSYWINMALIFGFTFIFCTWAYRSWLGALVLFVPLVMSQVLCDMLMLLLGIDLNINSLPVASVGVGVGVDYGIYILSRLAEEYQFSNGDYNKARFLALTSTGKAIIFTASTLVLSVVFFCFASFKFQAEMALMLAFLLTANAIGALAVLPALVSIVGPERLLKKYRI